MNNNQYPENSFEGLVDILRAELGTPEILSKKMVELTQSLGKPKINEQTSGLIRSIIHLYNDRGYMVYDEDVKRHIESLSEDDYTKLELDIAEGNEEKAMDILRDLPFEPLQDGVDEAKKEKPKPEVVQTMKPGQEIEKVPVDKMEDYSEDDLNSIGAKVKSKTQKTDMAVRQVKDEELQPQQLRDNKLTESGELYLCNSCFKTFRANESVCCHCKSNKVEKIVKIKEEQKTVDTGQKFKFTGGGVDDGKIVTVVDKSKIKLDGRGIPTNVQGAYKQPDWSKEVPIQYEDGKYGLMFIKSLIPIKEDFEEEHGLGKGGKCKKCGKRGSSCVCKTEKEKGEKVKESKQLKESVEELIEEVPTFTKEQKEALHTAIKTGVVPNEWPENNIMFDALSLLPNADEIQRGLDKSLDVAEEVPEPGEEVTEPIASGETLAKEYDLGVRVAYLKYVLLPRAEKAYAKVSKSPKSVESKTIQEAEIPHQLSPKQVDVLGMGTTFVIEMNREVSDLQGMVKELSETKTFGMVPVGTKLKIVERLKTSHVFVMDSDHKYKPWMEGLGWQTTESKIKEAEETLTVVAKGIAKKEDADKIATDKKGMVITDDEDNTKFMIVVKKE